MKTRHLLLGLVLCALAGVGIWYYVNPPPPAAMDKPAPAKVAVAPTPVAKPTTMEAPKRAPVAPAVAPVVAASAKPVAAAKADLSIPEAKADLKECITQTIKLLEAKDVAALIKTLMPPPEVQRMIDSGRASSMDDIIAQFSQRPDLNERMAEMQRMLESVKDLIPDIDADGQKATYHVDPSISGRPGRDTISFIQIDGNWYLQ